MSERGEGEQALKAAGENSLLLDKLCHELHSSSHIKDQPFDLMPVCDHRLECWRGCLSVLCPLRKLPLIAQGRFSLVSLGGNKDRLHPPQGR